MFFKKIPEEIRNILFHVGHPAHVYFLKNALWNLEEKGYNIYIVATEKEVTLDLLNAYGFKYEVVGKNVRGVLNKTSNMMKIEIKLSKIIRKYKADLLVGVGSICMAHAGILTRRHYINFGDTEISKFDWLLLPFSDVLIRPICYKEKVRDDKEVRYDGYKELAYLHPNYFIPDTSVLDELNISRNEGFIILRFISWGASHDIGLRGLKKGTELEFIKSLEKFGNVFITSERMLNPGLEKYRLKTPPEKIHSLLYYADLYIGEGGTMATEAAILGTPAIHIESTSKGIATGELSGNFLELRDKYGLLYFYPDQNQALKKAISILEDKNSKNEWRKKREKLLKDKIDVTAWMTDFIERYPESFYEYKEKKEGENVSCII